MRHVFIDESCQNAHQFMVLGALVLPGQLVGAQEQQLGEILAGYKMSAELKWTKVSNSKLCAYQALVDFHFDELVPRGASFHALVVDCHALDHGAYNQGDPDLGYNKFLYQLLFHKVGKVHGRLEKIVADLDARNSTRDVLELQTVLNHRMIRDYGMDRQAFTRIAMRDSKSTRLLQVADILSGAIAWHKNDHDARPGSSEAKAKLANHTAKRLGLRRLGHSKWGDTRLEVWNFQLGPRGGKGRPAV